MDASSTLVPSRCAGLVRKIHGGECVLVLGPRIAVPAFVSPDHASISLYLEQRLLEDLETPAAAGDPPDAHDLRAAIARAERTYKPKELRGRYEQLIERLDADTTDLHRDLAKLPFKLVLMATPDRMMFTAFQQAGKSTAREEYYDYTQAGSDEQLTLPSREAPVVYSLFGRHDHPESMVITDRNLLDYLVNVTKESPKLPDWLRATLRAPATSFLFVGFGFRSWWLRLFLKVLDITGNESRSLSLAIEDADADAESKGFFESDIFIQSGDWGALAKELVAGYQQVTSQDAARAKLPQSTTSSENRPLVFLSYASEDRDKVTELGKDLEARGIAVWQDVNNLRAGLTWESQLMDYIKRVNYFVFIQSANMDRRDVTHRGGVYYRELAQAQERARDLRPGTPFVYYVALGDCPIREELSALHRVRVDNTEGVEALASAILSAFAPPAAAAGVGAAGTAP